MISRRQLVKTGTALLASGAFASHSRRVLGAGDKIRVGLIGAGMIGKWHFKSLAAAPDAEVVALAEIDPKRMAEMAAEVRKRHGRGPRVYRDFRKLLADKDVDAVFVATPDHWHALMAIMACQAGKDVYVEKPLAHNVAEGRAIVTAAGRYQRIVQVGTQQRSNKIYQDVIEYIRGGKLGRVSEVQTYNHYNREPWAASRDEAPPAGVDYEMWLGPAPRRRYNSRRFHGSWRYFRDYGGGYVTDWNTHHMDVVHQALLGAAPRSVAMSGFVTHNDLRDMPDTAKVVWEYSSNQGDFLASYTVRAGNARGLDFGKKWTGDHGIAFFGSLGTLVVRRDGWTVYPEDQNQPPIENQGETLMEPHVQNFMACIKSRAKTLADPETIHQATLVNHIANISYFVGRRLHWDARRELLCSDPDLRNPDAEANQYLLRQPRTPWQITV